MSLRLVELVLPEERARSVDRDIGVETLGGPWTVDLGEGWRAVRWVVDTEKDGDLLDKLEARYGAVDGFQVAIYPVQAMLPRPPQREEDKKPGPLPRSKSAATGHSSITREELHDEVSKMARPTRVYLATVVLSTLVVTVGLLRGNTAVIIGAMVIAPLLGPNVAVALATTLGDGDLLRRGLTANVVGFTLAFVLTLVIGALFPFDPTSPEIAMRTHVHWSDLVLALASGSAGALALATRVSTSLVGVMVAVALLPPTATVGLLTGAAHWDLLGGAVLQLATNIVCVSLAGCGTFWVLGIRPATWWEEDRAQRAVRRALLIGLVLVVILTVLIVAAQPR